MGAREIAWTEAALAGTAALDKGIARRVRVAKVKLQVFAVRRIASGERASSRVSAPGPGRVPGSA
jgi:hypothetical protein